MKIIILLTILTLEIYPIYSDFETEWQSVHKVCCEQAYKSSVSRDMCALEMGKAMRNSLIENSVRKILLKRQNDAAKELLIKYTNEPENKKRYEGFETNSEGRLKITNHIYNENKKSIDEAGNEASREGLYKVTGNFKTMCLAIAKEIQKENDIYTFTVEVFALIVASATAQLKNEDYPVFIKYLKDNKDVLEKLKILHADLWQRLYYLDNNLLNVLKTCNCKEILFTNGFHRFLRWLFVQKNAGTVNLCPLMKIIEVYKNHKSTIDEDADKNKATIIADMKDCKA